MVSTSKKYSFVPGAWGNRLELNRVVRELDRFLGSKERAPARGKKRFGAKRIKADHLDSVTRLLAFRAQCESNWGELTTRLDLGRVEHGELFAVRKALSLSKLSRLPSDVSEGFLTASGNVDGRRIEPREIFWQRFRPMVKPRGHMVVISPAFGGTGRDYYESATQLNSLGYDVLLMDHQWAGHSDGMRGYLDSGFGIARDVAAITAYAYRLLQREYEVDSPAALTLVGKNLGASAGVLGAIVLNDAGLLRLDGRQMPKGLNAVLVSPWLGAGESLINKCRKLASQLPVINQLVMPRDVPEGVLDSPKSLRARFRAMAIAKSDIDRLCSLVEQGRFGCGKLYVIHSSRHPFIDPVKSAWLVSRYENAAKLRMVDTRHIRSPNSKAVTRYVIEGILELANNS